MIQITITEKDYFLPEDGPDAEKVFLNLLNGDYQELWISAFGFTLQPMFDAIKAADARGVKCHILLDHSQSGGTAEKPKVQDLVNSLKNGEVVITTAGAGSGKPSDIWHWKGMVARFEDGNDAITRFGAMASNLNNFGISVNASPDNTTIYFCWEGSTNFSQSGWDQGNSARLFSNITWAEKFVEQHGIHAQWAEQNEPQYQLKPGGAVVAPAKKKKKTRPSKKTGN